MGPWILSAETLRGRLPLLLIVSTAFVVTALFTRSVHGFFVMPDELTYVKQAVAIWHNGMLLHGGSFWFTSYGQLLPLISAPLFGALSMANAFYVSHTFYALLLASTAIPAYLTCRELGLPALAANLVAALTVAVPWLVYAGMVMTEVVAYPALAWALLQMLRTTHEPSPKRDIAALLSILIAFGARTQLVVLAPILLVAVLVHEVAIAVAEGGRARPSTAVIRGVKQAVHRHRVLWSVACAVLLALGVLAIVGSATVVLGNYAGPARGDLLPPGTFFYGREQLGGVVLAIGVVPFTFAMAWALASIGRPPSQARHAFAVVLLATVATLFVVLGSFNARYLPGTTDRYMFYLAPLMFAGAAAWIVDRRGGRVLTVIVAAGVAWLLLTSDLHPEGPSMVNPSFSIDRVFVGQASRLARVLGIKYVDARVPIAIVASLFVLLALAARRRMRPGLALSAVLLPVLAYGILDTGYTMTKLSKVPGPVASWGSSLAFVDRAVPSGSIVGVIIAPIGTSPWESDTIWWETDFWNKTIRRVFYTQDPLGQGSVRPVDADFQRGRLTALDGSQYLLVSPGDPRFGLAGAPVLRAAGLALYRIRGTGRLRYASVGIADTGLFTRPRSLLRIYADAHRRQRELVTLTLLPHAGGPVTLRRIVGVPAGGHADIPLPSLRGPRGTVLPWQRLVSVSVTAA